MKTIAKILLSLLCAGLVAPQTPPAGQKSTDGFRVNLRRVDGVKPWAFGGFVFDPEAVAKTVKEYPVKLPSPLPEGAVLGYEAGPLYILKQKAPDATRIRLLLDVDTDLDLTNNSWIELPAVEGMEQATIVAIVRRFGGAAPHSASLPYRIWYHQRQGRDGKIEDVIYFASDYVYRGEFSRQGRDYSLELFDGDARGRFVREKMSNVDFVLKDKSVSAPANGLRFFELFPFEKALYKVQDFAEDGSWMEFAPSGLVPTLLGKPAPDFEMTDAAGQVFRLSDYRGKVLLLDFWYVWCKPCIAKFPSIKKKLDSLAGKPFVALGINIDEASRVEQARKVIADNGLTWRQVVEGKGAYIPAYQIYGRLPEHPMSFPIYVAIDEEGISRYATNDFDKMCRYLDAHFDDPAGPGNTLFVPLGRQYGAKPQTQPLNAVDFVGPRVKELVASGKLKMPPDTPKDARVGILTNGKALVASLGPQPGQVRLIVDADHNFDLNGEKEYLLRIPPDAKKIGTEEFKTTVDDVRLPYANGGMAGFPLTFQAKPAAPGVWPEIFVEGIIQFLSGSFVVDGTEYALETADLTGDFYFNEFDTTAPGFLKLKTLRGGEWVQIHEGTSHIPIGGALYRLRHVSDDGCLVELEKER
ncbi:MAG: TlpA disulfide reductase family protein [Candidatus Aminicenantes bacterium]|nr:TlpA disulfide reductase family protein [Candidatus Aminicenantes bacterium]